MCTVGQNYEARHEESGKDLERSFFFFSNSINTRLCSTEPHVARLQFKPSSAGRGGEMCAKSCQMGDVE